jgi:uncharacterized protein
MANSMITVELIFALPEEQDLLTLQVQVETTIEQAIHASGILTRYPQIDLNVNKVGIFGKVTTLDTILQEGDRIEIYRALIADPKEVRKKKAAMQKEGKV